ncbi:hypothetical protein IEO21_06250 [Rhodonia placenta]|uniref:Uncharacterized protein n=1 Tax=Rhodonia placenta TaxID=104341 RepID=A0A8H7U1B7_9APHY|nr:hypothetical protein IEO21_06250 [Postia placenta]
MMKPTLIHEQIPDIITFLTHVNMIRKFAHSKAIAVLKWNEHYVRHPQPDIVTLTKDDCLLLESLAIDSDDAQQMFRQIVNDLSRLDVCRSYLYSESNTIWTSRMNLYFPGQFPLFGQTEQDAERIRKTYLFHYDLTDKEKEEVRATGMHCAEYIRDAASFQENAADYCASRGTRGSRIWSFTQQQAPAKGLVRSLVNASPSRLHVPMCVRSCLRHRMVTPLEFSPSSLALLPNLAFSPPIGIYIALWLDPVGMAEELNISSVLTAAQAMTPRKYLGYVHVVRDFPLPSRPWHRCHIRFVGEGMPEEQPEKGILPDMCTPIEPTTAHPAGREPLHPSRPFPYPNCYQHHFIDDLVRVPTQIIQYDDCVRLRPREMRRHMNYENGDWVIRRALVKDMEDREVASPNHDAENSGVPPAIEVDGEDHATDSDGHEESVQEDADDSGDPPDFMQVLALVMTAGDRLDMDIDILPLVRISLDLTEGGKFEDPRGFLEEVATMTQ